MWQRSIESWDSKATEAPWHLIDSSGQKLKVVDGKNAHQNPLEQTGKGHMNVHAVCLIFVAGIAKQINLCFLTLANSYDA